jgi:hypothetical protein
MIRICVFKFFEEEAQTQRRKEPSMVISLLGRLKGFASWWGLKAHLG